MTPTEVPEECPNCGHRDAHDAGGIGICRRPGCGCEDTRSDTSVSVLGTTEVPEEERARPTKDELVGPVSPIWCCERTGIASSMVVGGLCPVHLGDACLARYDHYTTIDRLTKERDRWQREAESRQRWTHRAAQAFAARRAKVKGLQQHTYNLKKSIDKHVEVNQRLTKERDEARAALRRVVEQTEEWNKAVEAIIGREPQTGIDLGGRGGMR